MPLFAWIVALSPTIGVPLAHAQPAQIAIVQPAEATTMDLGRSTQDVIVYGTSKRLAFRPRPDFPAGLEVWAVRRRSPEAR